MDREYFYRNAWLWKCGLPEIVEKGTEIHLKVEELIKSEWSDLFEKLMRNRLIMGAFRYGKINAPNKKKYNRLKSISKRLKNYEETGNDEFLVDIANLAMLEFIEGTHPNKHFKSIDDGEHVTS